MERGIARVWNLDSAIGGDEHEERGRMIHTNEIRLLETADVIHVSIFVYNVIYIYIPVTACYYPYFLAIPILRHGACSPANDGMH